MKKLSEMDAFLINKKQIEIYSPGELVGVKDAALLNSAINRPFQTMFGKSLYPDINDKAVALFESLAKNHPFHNANKRTAFACLGYFLFINNIVLLMNEQESADLTVDFVTGKVTFEEVVRMVRAHSYRK